MRLEKDFLVSSPRDALLPRLDDDETFRTLFPGTEVRAKGPGVRETRTPYTALGQSREVRFVFETGRDGNLRFEKICDGNVWRSLEGEVRLEPAGARTRVVLRMEGRTRTLVPELAIRGPMKEQFDQMVAALQARLRG
jgi:carbon monoxide dehydrogenase subunit G